MAAIGAILGVVAAVVFVVAGAAMVGLRSQAGNTVAEAFYQAMGVFSFGMAGMALLAILILDRLILLAGVTEGETRSGADWKTCVECLEPVRVLATKCPHCASDLLGEPDAAAELADANAGR